MLVFQALKMTFAIWLLNYAHLLVALTIIKRHTGTFNGFNIPLGGAVVCGNASGIQKLESSYGV